MADTLDHEKADEYDFNVVATDQGSPPLSSKCRVIINIIDINDNSPMFEKDTYTVEVPEDVSAGKEILRVKAIDKDSTEFLEYAIVSPQSDTFKVSDIG